jgi:uncharacterized protein YjbI with pentapeptide repeats
MRLSVFRRWFSSTCIALIAVLWSGGAMACSCANVDVVPADFLREVDLLFVGDLQSTRRAEASECNGCTIGTFKVAASLKGHLGQTVDVRYYTEEGSSCSMGFPLNEHSTVAAYRNDDGGYDVGYCAQYIVGHGERAKAILSLAATNRARSAALTPAPDTQPDRRVMMIGLQWFSDYQSNEEGLAVADKLLALDPHDRDGLLFKEQFLSALNRDLDALQISDQLLSRDPSDSVAQQRRVLALVRLKRFADVPADWRDFSGLDVSEVDFGGRDLSHASFHNARLTKVSFKNAVLREADFSGSYLQRTDLSEADLSGANFDGSTVHADFERAILVRSSFDRAKGYPNFSGANLSDAVLTSTSFAGARFVGATAHRAILAGSCLEADFSQADLSGADLRDAQIWSTEWDRTILRNVDLRGTFFEGDLSTVDAQGAVFSEPTPDEDRFTQRGATKVKGLFFGETYPTFCRPGF